jgi:hypothetical protein
MIMRTVMEVVPAVDIMMMKMTIMDKVRGAEVVEIMVLLVVGHVGVLAL